MEPQNSKNAYVCDNLHATVTTHKDQGVTPMFISCPKCGAQAASRMGRVNTALNATHEWFKPTDDEVIAEAKFYAEAYKLDYKVLLEATREHVAQGGLLMRKIQF